MPNIEQEAHRFESASQHHEGKAALDQLQRMPLSERMDIIKQMERDARDVKGSLCIDKGALVFSSPFSSEPVIKDYVNKIDSCTK